MFLPSLLVSLALVFTTSAKKTKIDELVTAVSGQVSEDLVQLGKIDKTTAEKALPASLDKVQTQIRELKELGVPESEVARKVGHQVARDPRVAQHITSDGVAPRVIGAAIMGVAQIVTDLVSMGLSRY